jgi:hypothetical protein
MTTETATIVRAYCPGCRAVVDVELFDSLNWGNVVAMCLPADHEFAYTPIDHHAILREAKGGFGSVPSPGPPLLPGGRGRFRVYGLRTPEIRTPESLRTMAAARYDLGMTLAVTPPVRVRIHACVDCARLDPDDQPRAPRPAPHGGPRSRRCTTHWRAHERAEKARRRMTYVERVFGITPDELDELWTFQGEACVCGRQPSRSPDIDHDHACCPGRTSCGQCVRGALCRQCNREVIGRYTAAQLRALADYLDDPPMARMRRQRLEVAS